MLIVDGYNLIHASDRLSNIADENLESAREALISDLIDYSAREGCEIELIFDAAKTRSGVSKESRSGLLSVTFTAKGQSADDYIEKLAYDASLSRDVVSTESESMTVVTGDYNQQKVASGAGLLRQSPREFLVAMRESSAKGKDDVKRKSRKKRVRVSERLPDDVREELLKMREKL